MQFLLNHGPQISIENAETQAATKMRIRPPTAAKRAAHFSRGALSWVVIAVLIPYPPFVVFWVFVLPVPPVVWVPPLFANGIS